MELSELKTIIKGEFSEAQIKQDHFGKQGEACLWIELNQIQKTAEILKENEMDWLENISVFEKKQKFILTYFIRSFHCSKNVILRGTVAPKNPLDIVEVPSIENIWPTSAPMEKEIEGLFGIYFTMPGKGIKTGSRGTALFSDFLTDLGGYPLRKCYKLSGEILVSSWNIWLLI